MVKYKKKSLDRTFAALADPTRRALLARLGDRDEPLGQRTGAAVCDVAARDHEASRRAVGRRPGRAREDRPHRGVPADRQADGAGDGLAEPLPALLVRKPRPPCRFCGGRPMATQSTAAEPVSPPNRASPSSAGSMRRPEKVYAAWTDPKKVVCWFGPAKVRPETMQAEIDAARRRPLPLQLRHDATANIIEVCGVYREVVPNERLVFSWAWHSTPERESLVTVTLKPRRRRHAAHPASRAILR